MSKIVYYVASSIDGYIAGENDDISMFSQSGDAVDKYLSDLEDFKTVIMGRRTYEFGYQFGLIPGQPAYKHMEHYIFSDTLNIENLAKTVHIEKKSINRVIEIKNSSKNDIYLCGGGEFAGWLLENGLIDQLKLKLNPIILNCGIHIFGKSKMKAKLELCKTDLYKDGLCMLTYNILKK